MQSIFSTYRRAYPCTREYGHAAAVLCFASWVYAGAFPGQDPDKMARASASASCWLSDGVPFEMAMIFYPSIPSSPAAACGTQTVATSQLAC